MLSSLTKCLALVDPDVYIFKAIKHLGLHGKLMFDAVNITIAGVPVGLIGLGVGIIAIVGLTTMYKIKNNNDISNKINQIISSEKFAKRLIIASGIITIIIFSI